MKAKKRATPRSAPTRDRGEWRLADVVTMSARVREAAAERPADEGHKADVGKLRFDLLPPDALREVVRVMTMGALKYSDRNWEKGMDWSRCEAALRRHLNEYSLRNDIDDESGMPHLAHVAVNALFLLSFWLRGDGVDDRPYLETYRSFPFDRGSTNTSA